MGIRAKSDGKLRALFAAALTLGVAFSLEACARPPAFDQGITASEAFAADRRDCLAAASGKAAAAEAQAERYDSGSAGQIVGAGIAAMVAGAGEERRLYTRCMKAAGYRPAPRASKPAHGGGSGAGPGHVIVESDRVCGRDAIFTLSNNQPVARVEKGRLAISYLCYPRGKGAASPLRILVVDELPVASAEGSGSLVRDIFLQLRDRSADLLAQPDTLPPTPLTLDVQFDESRYLAPHGDLGEAHYPLGTAMRVTAERDGSRCFDVDIRAATRDPFGNGEKEARFPWFARTSIYIDDSCQIFFAEIEDNLVIMKARRDMEFRYRGLLFKQISHSENK